MGRHSKPSDDSESELVSEEILKVDQNNLQAAELSDSSELSDTHSAPLSQSDVHSTEDLHSHESALSDTSIHDTHAIINSDSASESQPILSDDELINNSSIDNEIISTTEASFKSSSEKFPYKEDFISESTSTISEEPEVVSEDKMSELLIDTPAEDVLPSAVEFSSDNVDSFHSDNYSARDNTMAHKDEESVLNSEDTGVISSEACDSNEDDTEKNGTEENSAQENFNSEDLNEVIIPSDIETSSINEASLGEEKNAVEIEDSTLLTESLNSSYDETVPETKTEEELPVEDSNAVSHNTEDAEKDKKPKKKSFLRSVREFVVIILVALVLCGVINNFVAKQYTIPSGSMIPTLQIDDRIVVDRMVHRFKDVKSGDIVVFKGPDGWNDHFVSDRSSNPLLHKLQDLGAVIGIYKPDENDLVKRVIATGGQVVQCRKGDPGIMVNGRKMDSSYTNTVEASYNYLDPEIGSVACGGEYFGPITVKPGYMWVMGDNRFNSADSRYHLEQGAPEGGQVPVANIRGIVRFIMWPFSRWQRTPNHSYAPEN